MAIDGIVFSPEQSQLIACLRDLAGMSEQDTMGVLIEGGLEALRSRAAATLYATRPLSVSEVAEMVGLTRGACIEWFQTHGIAPWASVEEADAVFADLDAWLGRQQSAK
ncbi:MAG: hypothetical protein M0Z53_01405 [Thermaerobacter sp.]|nr:hypothetical protein [Thermaerobacter sp.]